MTKFKVGDVIEPIEGGIIELIIDVNILNDEYLTFAIPPFDNGLVRVEYYIRVEYYTIEQTDKEYDILLNDFRIIDIKTKYKIYQLTEIIEK